MARFWMKGTEELASQLMDAARLDSLAQRMIEGALSILEREMKDAVQQEADKGYATGQLAASIKKGKARKNKYGHFGMVSPSGKDRGGLRNGEKLGYLEFGTVKQEARPVVAKAIARAEREVVESMQETCSQEIGGSWR